MLLLIAAALFIAWILTFGVFHVASFAIHVLIVLAVIAVIAHFIRPASRSGRLTT